MFFTITITTYNRSKLLCRCLDSVKKQTFKDYELLILDDCSNDNTQEVVKAYLQDERFKYIRCEKNLGFGDKVFKKAQDMGLLTGEWIGLLSDDEYFYSALHLEKIHQAIKQNPSCNFIAVDCGYGYFGVEIFSNNEKLPTNFRYSDLTLEQKKVLDEKIKVFYKKDFLIQYDVFNAQKHKRDVYYEVPYQKLYEVADLLYVPEIAHIFGISANARRKYLDFYNWIVSSGMMAFDKKDDRVLAYETFKKWYCDPAMCLNAFFDWGGEALAKVLSYFVADDDFPKYLEEFARIYKEKFQEDLYRYYDSFNAMLMSEDECEESLQNAKNIVLYGENSYREQVQRSLISRGKNILFIADDGRSGTKNYRDIIHQKHNIDLVFITSASPKVIWQMFCKLQPKDNGLKVATLIVRDEEWKR